MFDRVIKIYPKSAYADIFSGRSTGIILDGFGATDTYVRDHPNFSSDLALLSKAQVLKNQGKTSEAIQILSDFVSKHPNGRWSGEDRQFQKKLRSPIFFYVPRFDDEVFLEYAALLIAQKDTTQAIAVLNGCTSRCSSYCRMPGFYDLLAQGYQIEGKSALELDALVAALAAGSAFFGSDVGHEFDTPVMGAQRTRKQMRDRLAELDSQLKKTDGSKETPKPEGKQGLPAPRDVRESK